MRVANVVCIKWGDKYPAHYVNRLYWGVKRFMSRPFRFVCVTDEPQGIDAAIETLPLPEIPFEAEIVKAMTTGKRRGAWRKVILFKPGLAGMEGPVLGFDIDVVITGALDALLDYAPGKVCMRRDWLEARRRRPGGHGSVFRYDPALHGYLYEKFAANPSQCIRMSNRSEQKYTSTAALAHNDLEYFPPQWISSFKRNSIPIRPLNFIFEPRLPRDTRVMCFHGRPKIEEAIAGYRDEWLHATRPARWLRDYWADPDS